MMGTFDVFGEQEDKEVMFSPDLGLGLMHLAQRLS